MLGILIETENSYKELFKDLKCFILCAGFLDPFPINNEMLEHKEKIKRILVANNNFNNFNNKNENEKNEKSAAENNEYIISVPVLNIFGEADEIIKPEKSKNVEMIFKNVESFNHPGKHFIPSGKPDIEKYVCFLEKYLNQD
jgi:hypothetical protein